MADNIFKTLYEQIFQQRHKDYPKHYIAQHLSKLTLYGITGSNNIDTLHPQVKDRCEALIKRMEELGKPIWISSCLRTFKEQDNLYAQGRTSSGGIVTNAQGGQSYHNYGLAFDAVFQQYNWNPPSEDWWEELGKEGKALGLEWGGDWQGFRDRPHFEWHEGFTWKDIRPYFLLDN